MKRFFLLCLFIFCQLSLFAQKQWTLQECVEYALKNNLTIKQNEIVTQITGNNQAQSFLNMFPTLNASSSYSRNFGRSVDPFSYEFTTQSVQSINASLNAGVVLFNGLQLQNQLKQSKLDYLSAQLDLEKIKNDISLNVAAAYLQVLYAQEQLKAANDRVDAAKKQSTRTKSLVDAGTLPQGSFLDTEAQVANEEFNQATSQGALDNALLSLTQLLEIESPAGFSVEAPKVDIPGQETLALNASQIYEEASKTKPEIKSAEYKVQSAEKSLSIAKGSRYPRLSMFGSLSTGYSDQTQRIKTIGGEYIADLPTIYYTSTPIGNYPVLGPTYTSPTYEDSPFSNQLEDNFSKSYGLSLNIPIFNGWATETSVKRSRLNLEGSKYAFEQTKNTLYKSIQQAHTDAISALNRYTAAQKSSTAMQESFKYTEKKFQAGIVNSLDYLLARNNLTKSESDFLQAKYDFIFKLKVLDFYLGKPLVY